MIRLTVWGENFHEQHDRSVAEIYPEGMHAAIARAAETDGDITARTATLDQPEHGLTQDVLDQTDVLAWWGHMKHDDVSDGVVDRVHDRVCQGGMGLLALHSSHFAKVFKRLMGTSCGLRWRSVGETERLWVCNPAHPIARGVDRFIEIDREEMYGEPFGVPEADETVFVSWFQGGEVFRSGLCYRRGAGRVFYFRPGDQEYPTYHHPQVGLVIRNAVRWLAPQNGTSDGVWGDVVANTPMERAAEAFMPKGTGPDPQG